MIYTPCKTPYHISPAPLSSAVYSATGCQGSQKKGWNKEKKKCKSEPLRYFHLPIAEVQREEGGLHLWVPIRRRSKFASAQPDAEAAKAAEKVFLEHLIAAVPYTIYTVSTYKGIQLTHRKKDRLAFRPPLDPICSAYGIEQRLRPLKHPGLPARSREKIGRARKRAPALS